MGLRLLLPGSRSSSNALRAVRSRAAGNGPNISVTGSSLTGSIEPSRFQSVVGNGCLDSYARYSTSAYFRLASSKFQVARFSQSSSTAPLSTLSCSRTNLFPSIAQSYVAPRLRPGGILAQQLNPSSMQQKRGLSKLKKYKMKAYSSYKERFKLMADGTYKRWRSGTRHNAHSKDFDELEKEMHSQELTAKQRRQLRQPSTAPLALAKVMKKLNFIR